MRGAGEAYKEYLSEPLHRTCDFAKVDCSGAAAVILSEYSQIDWIIFTGCVYLKGSLCEQTVKKGGTTRFRPRPFVRTGALYLEKFSGESNKSAEKEKESCRFTKN